MSIILRAAGHQVMVAGDPQEAIALLATARPALALVDYVMPGMNGVEFCRWVRLQDEHAALRLVLLTGMDSVELHAEAQARRSRCGRHQAVRSARGSSPG